VERGEALGAPLRPSRKPAIQTEAEGSNGSASGKTAGPKPAAAPTPAKPARIRHPHPQTAIDRRTARRIARGSIALDGRIDLHGSDQTEAHERLARFLAAAQAQDWRLVLVITGKGNPGDRERGVLRRQLPHWLAAPRLRPLVSGYEQAHRSHGGSGAFYVRVRRRPGLG